MLRLKTQRNVPYIPTTTYGCQSKKKKKRRFFLPSTNNYSQALQYLPQMTPLAYLCRYTLHCV